MSSALRRRFILGALLGGALSASGALRADVVIPSSAYLTNSLGDDFRTDVRVFNPTNAPVLVTPVFYRQANNNAGISADTVTGSNFTVPVRGQVAFDNILLTVFGQTRTLQGGPFGPIRFQTTAPLLVSSATNNVNGCNHTGATQGQWIPGLDVAGASTSGTLLQLAASTDLLSGYRTNLVFFNPGATASATITANLRKGDGSLVSAATFTLGNGPAGFRQINRFSTDFSPAVSLADTNLYVDFTSDQSILAFASVINNVSGDPFALTAAAEATAPPPLPVASYTVSANPIAGQPVTFTDTSSGNPTTQLWSFGDGATAISGSTVTNTYTAAATHKTAHFVGNAAGVSAAAKDVTVGPSTPQTIQLTITAKSFLWEPKNVNLKVGQPYQITFQIDPNERDVRHGLGGPAIDLVGIGTQCDLIPLAGCTVNFTPTASHLNSPGPVYLFGCTQTMCGFGHDMMKAGGINGGTITITP